MNYKEVIYQNYVSNHNEQLYGKETLEKIKNNFPAWKYYFYSLLPTNKNAKILDIGCGNGAFVYFLHSLGFNNTQGIDVSNEQIMVGQNLGIKNLLVNDIKQYLTNNNELFDLIIARDVIEHFTKDEVFEINILVNKSLPPSGGFLIQVPNGQGLFHTSIFYGDYTHECAYTISSLNQVFKNTGFKNVICKPTGPVPSGFIAFLRFIAWKVVVIFIKIIKGIETGNPSGIFTQNIIALAQK